MGRRFIFHGHEKVDKYLFETFFPHQRGGFFVECGAFDGYSFSTCYFFETELGWTGLNIEPVPKLYECCARARPNCLNLNCALDNADGRATLVEPVGLGGNSSLCHTPEHWRSLDARGRGFKYHEVECRTYASLAREHNLPPVDLFVVDVEGAELRVIEGILQLPGELPQLICVEHGHVGLAAIQQALQASYDFHSTYAVDSLFCRKPDQPK